MRGEGLFGSLSGDGGGISGPAGVCGLLRGVTGDVESDGTLNVGVGGSGTPGSLGALSGEAARGKVGCCNFD